MIFLEIVPKDIDEVNSTCKWAVENCKQISGINIPDILRINNRSYDVSLKLNTSTLPLIPHLRIIDFSELELVNLSKTLFKNKVKKVLLVSGDPPINPTAVIHNHKIESIISTIKKEIPNLIIYAGLDPYRQSLKKEIEYSFSKLDAGADGLFTQPIFDINLAELLINQPFNKDLFIGISPVIDEKSYNYWCNRNSAFFPKGFQFSLDYNCKLAQSIIKLSKEHNQHNYLMPIKVDKKSYLKGIFSD